jgi:putative ABC transport system permease protein
MQAALPAIEINRLYDLLGIGFSVIRAIGALLVVIAAISVFISLLSSLKDRRIELALMRSLGASPFFLFGLILLESTILTVIGYAFGLIFGRIGLWVFGILGSQQFHMSLGQTVFSPTELWLFPTALLVGVLAALIPAIYAYRTEISTVLKSDV